MNIRPLPLVASMLLLSALFALTINVYEHTQLATKDQVSESQWVDIEAFTTGQTLAETLQNVESPDYYILRSSLSDTLAALQPGINVPQLIVGNIEADRVNRISISAMRRFLDKLPTLAENKNATKGFFAGMPQSEVQQQVENLLAYAREYKGTPYRWGGITDRGFDCSGFTQYAFLHIGVALPRTSHSQSKIGRYVAVADAQPGDMVFFGKKRGDTYSTNHTGIVLSNQDGHLRVIHSARRGVVVEEILGIESYKRRFLFIKRIL